MSEMVSQSIMSEFHSALDLIKTGKAVELADNYLRDIISQFRIERRVVKFNEDTKEALNELGSTLTDAEKIHDAIQEMDAFIDSVSAIKRDMALRYDLILEDHISRGVTEADGFRIEPTYGNRTIDTAKVKRQKEWAAFIEMRKNNLENEISLNQSDLKAMFQKQYEAFLQPGKVNGYKLVPVMPEKSGEVEL